MSFSGEELLFMTFLIENPTKKKGLSKVLSRIQRALEELEAHPKTQSIYSVSKNP